METRVEKAQKKKKEFKKQIFGIPKMLFFLILSLLMYMFTLFLWGRMLSGTVYYDLVETIVTINIMAIAFFLGLGYMNFKFLIVLVKSFLKIMFTVWIVIIVQFSSMEQIEQNAWIVLSAFFFVYLEVLLDINDCLFQIKDDFKMPKIKFLTSTFIKENSLSISIVLLSIINGGLSYFIVDILNAIRVV